MADLSNELNTSINELKSRHSALLTAVQAFRTNTVNSAKAELIAAYNDLNTQLEDEETTLLGLIARNGAKPQPSLVLDFAKQKYLVGAQRLEGGREFSDIITFTRSSGGGRFNSAGIYEWLDTNVPRIDYDPVTKECKGLLIEEQRTNLLKYSSEFDNAAWTKTRASISANAVAAPDGTVTADKLVEDATADSTHLTTIGASVTAGSAYTLSFFLKAGERDRASLKFPASGFGALIGAVFNLTTGGISAVSAGVTAAAALVGEGFYRCSITASATSNGVIASELRLALPSDATIYTGDGTSGIYIWGAQLEAGAFPTSYIPTTTAQVTRSADVASVNTLSPWYRQDAGTLFAEGYNSGNPGPSSAVFACLGVDQTTVNRQAQIDTTASGMRGIVLKADGGVQTTTDSFGGRPESPARAAVGYKTNDSAFSSRGTLHYTDTSVINTSSPTKLLIGGMMISQMLNGHIRHIRYYPKRLTDAQLQALTA